jgi:hypothetical protein
VIIELILKENYITEYSLSTELGLSIDRIRLVTNNLIKEKLINYEERSFKNLEGKKDFFRITKKKGFKLRYLYFDKIFFTFNLKKKFKKIISKSFPSTRFKVRVRLERRLDFLLPFTIQRRLPQYAIDMLNSARRHDADHLFR